MLNQLFTEVSSEQQETVVGGFTINSSRTGFFGSQQFTSTVTTSTPDGGSQSTSETINIEIITEAFTANGLNLPEGLTFAAIFG
ncbi:CTB family bacteriocin [Nodularia spumigena]|uniref:CTB family bacteriocin n=1 Tax=Nodularia spumigena TaxID=70799 RepID=UPI0023308FE4|nr:CTB family bacteriocin [Nodularia spumigena]MDB9335792.1 CTB family bacteriocin [Nodularia spumigena CS-590/01]